MNIFNEIKRDNIIGVRELLEELEDLNSIKSENGDSLLRYAIKNGASLAMFKLLVKAGGNIFEVDEEGVGLIDDAIKKGRADIVKFLVESGIDPNTTKRKSGFTPLMAAVSYGDEEITRYLVSLGVDTDIKDNFDYTAYDYAKMTGYKRMIEVIESEKSRTS